MFLLTRLWSRQWAPALAVKTEHPSLLSCHHKKTLALSSSHIPCRFSFINKIPLHICSLKSLWCGQVRGKILSLPAPAAWWGFAALQNIRQPEHPSTFRDVHTTRKALPAQAFDSTCRSAPSSLGGKATLTLPQTQRPREFQLNSN